MTSKRSLTIVQMNDSHAYFDLHQEMFWQGDHALYRPQGVPQKYDRNRENSSEQMLFGLI